MNIKTLPIVLLSLFLLSCCQPAKDPGIDHSTLPVQVVANTLTLARDSFAPPDSIPAGQPLVVRAGAPEIHPAHRNVRKAQTPRVVPAGTPGVVVPGQEGTLPPVVVAADFIQGQYIPSLPVRASTPKNREHNPMSFSFYNRLHGMQHDDVSSLIQDHRGNIWMGTYGGGAIVYNGATFTHFTENEGLIHNYVLSVFEDRDHQLWFGTRSDGLSRFDGQDLRHYTVEQGLPSNRIETIFQDSQGRMWFGTYNGVALFDGQFFTHYTREQGLAGDVVYLILEDDYGHLWFGMRGAGIMRFDGQKFLHYTTNEGLVHDFVVDGLKDRRGHLWFATDGGGLCRFDGLNFFHYTVSQGLMDNYLTDIREDRQGDIWIGTRSQGICRFDGDRFYHYGETEGLINSFVTALLEDRHGKIWFGTYGGGLGQFKGDLFAHFDAGQGLGSSFVRSIAIDKGNHLWFGTDIGGVYRYDGTHFYNYNTAQGMAHRRIGGITEDAKGQLWFATTGGGLSRFDGVNFYHYTQQQGLPENFLLSVLADQDNNIWLVTRNSGLVKFDQHTFYLYGLQQGLNDTTTRSIFQDNHQDIWVGSRFGGLTHLSKDSITYLLEEGGMAFNNLLDATQDRKGNIWIATNGRGVSRYDGVNFYHWDESHGLASNFVYSVLEDHKGQIWFGTRLGLSRFLHENIEQAIKDSQLDEKPIVWFKNYTYNEGFLGIGCNSRSILEDHQGRIWIGANDLLTVYHQRGDLPDTIPPVIQITSVGLFNEVIPWNTVKDKQDSVLKLNNGVSLAGYRFNSLTPFYAQPENLQLQWDNNYLTFQFVGITSHFERQIRYQYKLEGFDPGWAMLTERGEAHYGNLPSGRYRFVVRAVNSEGYWSDEASFSFRIIPPWWHSWPAWLMYVLLIGVSLGWFLRFRYQQVQSRIKKHQKELQLEQEIAIARKSIEFKQNFLANMSHEIRTPLTGILGMAEILSKTSLDAKQKDYLGTLMQAGENLRETINMVLDFSKLEAGKVRLKEQTFGIRSLFQKSEKLFASICNKDIVLETFIDEMIPDYILADLPRVNQIVNNLLSNAVKFTPEGSIQIRALVHQPGTFDPEKPFLVRVEVSDTGLGISKKDQEGLFRPFYQVEITSERRHEGTGLGLAICKELAQLLGGEIGVFSKEGQGSTFWFTFRAQKPDRVVNIPQIRKFATPIPGRPLEILLVEDKVINQKVISLMLQGLGHQIVLAVNGQEALAVFQPEKFDLILMDIQMPVMDGITAVGKLRELYTDLPPIVGLSANAFEGDREKYMALGMDEYLTKPVKTEDFSRMLIKLNLA